MRNFTTVCDLNYLPQGLALYRSLMRHNSSFILYWGCIGEDTLEAVMSLNLPNVVAYNATQFKSNGMSHKEYCWSLASRFTWWILERYNMNDITYLDADLYFYQDFEIIFKEIGNKSIGLIEHRIPSYKTVGKYNVAFNYFKNDEAGRECLQSWQRLAGDKGNEHFEEYGSCGDQKYLELFLIWHPLHIHVINCGHFAWWNSKHCHFDGDHIIWNGQRQLLIYGHYSHFKLTKDGYTHDEMIPLEDEKWKRLKQYYDEYAKEVRECQEVIK